MVKKSRLRVKKKNIVIIIIAAFLILCGLFGTYTYVRAGNFAYRHTSDELNMNVNSITYYYVKDNNMLGAPKKKNYTISSNWVDSLAIKHDVLGLGTNTTVYGPYTWLPAGQYKVQFDFTKDGGDVFKYWDVVVNYGANGMPQQYRTSTETVTIPESGTNVESPHYWTDGNGKGHLSYIINTTGDAADYELRLFFSDNLGCELPEGSNYDSQKGNQALYAFLENLSIESVNDNVITFDAQGGTVNGNATGTLLTTNWGKQRGNAPVPTRSGYVFDGWYGYSRAANTTGSRENLTFDTGSSEVKIWDTDGTPAIGTEVSYYGYEVHAKWTQVDQFVSYLGNGADNKEDYYISYNAAVTNQYNALDFKKTGYSGSGNWIKKDRYMNTTGTVSGSGRESMPQFSGLTSIRTKCSGRNDSVDINAASSDNGANAQIWDCINSDGQMFGFQYIKNEDGVNYWAIRNSHTGKVLDVAAGTGTNGGNAGANVAQYTYHGGDNQLWTLKMAGDGYFYICSKLGNCNTLDSSSLVLDLWGYNTDNGTNIEISGYHGGDNQQWYLWDNTINLSAEWTNTSYKVDYNADGGTLLDENGNATTDTVRTYEYDKIYSFLKARRAYSVSYETNGGTASIMDTNTNAAATFNGWNEQLDASTTHGEVHGWDGWSVGTWNWAAYYNGNPDLLKATNNTYDTMWAILHYREHGIDEGRTFNGASYWLPAVAFKNLTANGGTVNVKADYTNGSVTLPKAEKASIEFDGQTISYTFDGWYSDSELTSRVGGAGDTYTPAGNTTLYAKYIETHTPNRYAVTVEHYYMDTSGNYPEKPSVTQDLKPYYGETLVHKDLAREIKGLSFNENKTIQENGNRTQTQVKGNTVIKLYYDRSVCTVTYDYRTNGGTSADQETVKTYYGADADLSVAAYKNGWTHDGWNTKSSSQTGLAQYTVTDNVTLYAVYRKDITVTFVDFAQTCKREASMYNNDTYALIDAPQCSTYGGWENVSDIKAVGFNSRADITAEGAEKMEIKSGQTSLRMSENATYYTVCSAAVTLSYELNGGTENDTTKPVKEEVYCNAAAWQEVKGFALQLGESIKESFDLDGYTHSYTFATWAKNSPESETRFPCNAGYVLKENTVMYALWDESVTPITYYIEFDGNAGTAARNVPDKMEAQYGEEITLPKRQPERTGFTFTGWNTRTDGQGTTYQPEDTVKNLTTVNHATVKLYAQWKQRRIILVKAASTVYNDTIIRRIPGDEEWYNSVGHLTIDELKNYPDELCEQVWHIDKQGNITRVK